MCWEETVYSLTQTPSQTLADTRSYTSVHPTQSPNHSLSCECLKTSAMFLHISSLPSLRLAITHESAVCFPITLLWRGSPPPQEPVGSFNPPVRQYQTDVSIKEEPIYKSQLVCWIGGCLSEEDIREEGPSQEPPILQGAVFPQDMSVHLSSQKGLSSLC